MKKQNIALVFLSVLLFNIVFLSEQTQKAKSIFVSPAEVSGLYNVQTNSSGSVIAFDILTSVTLQADTDIDNVIVASFLQNSFLLTRGINVSYADYQYTDITYTNFQAAWMHAHSFLVSLLNTTSSIAYNNSYIKIWKDVWNRIHTENTIVSRYMDVKEMTASRNSTQIGMYYLFAEDGGWNPFGYTTTSDVWLTVQMFVHFSMNYSSDYLTSSENEYPKPFLPSSYFRQDTSLSDNLYNRFITIAPIMILVFVVFYLIKKLTNSEKYIGIAILPCAMFILIYLQASTLEYFVIIGLAGAITLQYFKKKNEGENLIATK